MLLMTAEMRPSFHKSPTARPREELSGVDGRAGNQRNIGECAVAIVVIEDARLLKIAAEMILVHFGINVAVDKQQIGPAIVVKIQKHRAPAEILGVQTEAGGESHIVKVAIAIVAIERGSVVGEIGFENIELAVAVEIGDGRAHAGLLRAIFVEGRAGNDGDIGKRAIVIVVIENAGSAVAGDVDIRPAVIIEVESGDAESVVSGGLVDVRLGGDVFKFAVASIVVQNIFRAGQAARAAHDRDAFPYAGRALPGSGRGGNVEVHVIGDHEVEMAVAVVVHESAAGTPELCRCRRRRLSRRLR